MRQEISDKDNLIKLSSSEKELKEGWNSKGGRGEGGLEKTENFNSQGVGF